MIDPSAFLATLEKNEITFFAGVPDSLLQSFCARLFVTVSPNNHIIAANEGNAVGLAAGYHLATGRTGCVYMQNSGLGNAVNPLTSLMDREVYSIPSLLLIGWRGEIANGQQISDEPQHVKQGRITLDLLDCLDIPYAVLQADMVDADGLVDSLVRRANAESRPVALVVRKGTFSGGEGAMPPAPYSLTREDAIKTLVAALPDDAIVVSTTGKASRELYEIRLAQGRKPGDDFLTVGSMGHALQIASGIAMSRPEKTVTCIDGDGALLMHMGGMTTSATISNLIHVVMNNGAHESVGGQPTKGFAIDMPQIARACGYTSASRASDEAEIGRAVREAITARRSSFLEIRTRSGSRANLGRPKDTPKAAKQKFMLSLGVWTESH